jgi:hypothetical protein
MMSLAKHYFAKLRVYPVNNTCWNHALAVIRCARFSTCCQEWLILLDDVGDQRSLCMVNDQLVGNPKRKV